MRYWKFIESHRVIKVEVEMNPDNWIEITKEEYEILKNSNKLSEKNS